jgi:hypothetical protein
MPGKTNSSVSSESFTNESSFGNESIEDMHMSNGVISRNNRSGNLLANGHNRSLAANKERIRKEVLAEYGDELRAAGWFHRLLIRRRIRKEIKRRLSLVAPIDANY